MALNATKTESVISTVPQQSFVAEPAFQLLLLVVAGMVAYRVSKKQLRKLKQKLLLRAVQMKLKNLFHFTSKKAGKDPAFLILLVGLAVVGLALLLGASTLTAVLIALVLCAIIGAAAYDQD